MEFFRSFVKYWLPVLLWMTLIFSASTDTLSSSNTSRVIGPLLHWFYPDVSEETVSLVQTLVRKSGHLSEYAILALLVWRAIHKPVKGEFRPMRWPESALTLLLVSIYAAGDEFHQSFVPSRQGSLGDVSLDMCGAAAGLLALWLWRFRREPRFVLTPKKRT